MKTVIKLFARARDLVGASTVELDLSESATVADLRVALGERYPNLRPLVANLLVSVGTDYAAPTSVIAGRKDVACFPPVSGG